MDCGTPPGGAAEVGESVEEETEATEAVRRGGRDVIAAAAVAVASADGRSHGDWGDRDLGGAAAKASSGGMSDLVRQRRGEEREPASFCLPVCSSSFFDKF